MKQPSVFFETSFDGINIAIITINKGLVVFFEVFLGKLIYRWVNYFPLIRTLKKLY